MVEGIARSGRDAKSVDVEVDAEGMSTKLAFLGGVPVSFMVASSMIS